MPIPFFWICMGITTAAIGAVVAYEAHMRFTQFQEEQAYQRYARQYAEAHPPPPPSPPPQEHHKENDSGDEEGNDEDDIKHFVRDINDNHELRRRLPRSGSPPLTTNDDSQPNNRPVSDQSWVDDTDYELNEMERKLTDKKQSIERQQELLDKAEMDLERRWQIHQNRSSELLQQIMSTSSFSSDHLQHDNINGLLISTSSSLSIEKQADCEPLNKANSHHSTLLYASSTNDHVTSMLSSNTSRLLNNSSLDDESPGRLTPTNNDSTQQQLASFAISAPPSSIQSSFISTESSANLFTTSSSASQEQQHQQVSASSNGLSAENPWSFEDDDDSDDDNALSLSFQTSMGLSAINDHPSSSESQHETTEWDEHSSANDAISISSRENNSTSTDHDINSLLSPSDPSSSSSVGGSYDSVHSSDFENGY